MESLLAEQVLEGRYRIVRRLATGGMATIYLAEHILIGRAVAIKVLHPQYAEDEDYVKRFLAEGRTAGTLGHPHIVASTDMGHTSSGSPYLVLELLEGRGLNEEIRNVGQMPIDRALTIALQIGSAVAAAHTRGIIHRDLKSDNIFLIDNADGDHVKVLDFGISKFAAVSGQTRRDKVLGTPWYMPPEQVEDPSSVDARCDVYALGAILYEMLAGQTPFADSPFPQVLVKILSEEPVPIETLRPDIAPELAAAVRNAMARSLTERTRDMDELGRALAAIAGRPWPEVAKSARAATTPPPARRKRRWGVIAGATGAVMVGAAAIGIAIASWPGSPGPNDGDDGDDGAEPAAQTGSPTQPPETQGVAPPAAPAVDLPPDTGASAAQPVELAIKSSTRGARVAFRGETYELPMREQLARGAGPEPIDVSAPGHAVRRSSITLDRDQKVTLEPGKRIAQRGSAATTAQAQPEQPEPSGTSQPTPLPASPEPGTTPEPGSPEPGSPESPPPLGGPPPEPAPEVPTVKEPAPPARTSPPAATRPQPGTMDRQATREAVAGHLREIRTCFERGRMDNPQLAGRVLVRIAVAPSGKVTSAKIAQSNVRSQPVEACIVTAVERWTLPAPAGGVAATITYPFSYH